MVDFEQAKIYIEPRGEIEALLRKYDLRVTCYEMFCRWHFQMNDSSGALVWHMKSHDLEKIQKSMIEFLENYDNDN